MRFIAEDRFYVLLPPRIVQKGNIFCAHHIIYVFIDYEDSNNNNNNNRTNGSADDC